MLYRFKHQDGYNQKADNKQVLLTRGHTAEEELQSCSLWNENHIHRKTDKMKRQGTMYQMKEQDKTPEK